MSALFSLVIAVVGCGSSPGATQTVTTEPATDTAASPGPPSDELTADEGISKLHEQLAGAKVQGFAMVRRRIMYYPTVEDARGAPLPIPTQPWQGPQPAPNPGIAAVRILEDLGDVVKVSTATGTRQVIPIDPRVELELYVKRAALLPVLREAKSAVFEDGTAYFVREGTPLTITAEGVRPAMKIFQALPIALEPSDASLSFELPALAAKLPESKAVGARVACGEPPGCVLEVGSTHGSKQTLRVGDRTLGAAGDVQTDRCRGEMPSYSTAENGTVLVELDLGRVMARVKTSQLALKQSGGCGSGTTPSARQVRAALAGAAVTFEDGSPAGKLLDTFYLDAPRAVDSRSCVSVPYVSVPLCFETASLELIIH